MLLSIQITDLLVLLIWAMAHQLLVLLQHFQLQSRIRTYLSWVVFMIITDLSVTPWQAGWGEARLSYPASPLPLPPWRCTQGLKCILATSHLNLITRHLLLPKVGIQHLRLKVGIMPLTLQLKAAIHHQHCRHRADTPHLPQLMLHMLHIPMVGMLQSRVGIHQLQLPRLVTLDCPLQSPLSQFLLIFRFSMTWFRSLQVIR